MFELEIVRLEEFNNVSYSPTCTGQLCSAPAFESQQPGKLIRRSKEVCCEERIGDKGTDLHSSIFTAEKKSRC